MCVGVCMNYNELQEAWIAPDGQIYPCDYWGHSASAQKLAQELRIPIPQSIQEDVPVIPVYFNCKWQDHLIHLGWILVGFEHLHCKRANQKQIDALGDLLIKATEKAATNVCYNKLVKSIKELLEITENEW